MKHWLAWHNGIFAGALLLLGFVAAWRAVPDAGTTGAGAKASSDYAARGQAALPFAELFNGELTQQFESHYDEVFPAKTFGVNLWAAIEYKLFNEGRAGVKVGRDGWLYTAEEFRTYADAQAQILRHLAVVAWVRDALARRGAELVVALLPAKRRVYPEYVGGHRAAPVHQRLYGLAYESLRGLRIHAPDLLTPLQGCKLQVQVFLRTDTHWTPLGARCAAQAIAHTARAAGATAPQRMPYRTRLQAVRPHRGDLLNFLPLDPYFAGWLPGPEAVAPLRTEAEFAAAEAGPGSSPGQALLDEAAPLPRVTLVGTSYSADPLWNFAGALSESLGEEVVNFADPGEGPFVPMLRYLESAELEQATPRLVIWEIPERYLLQGEALAAHALPESIATFKEDNDED